MISKIRISLFGQILLFACIIWLISCRPKKEPIHIKSWISKVNDSDTGMEFGLRARPSLQSKPEAGDSNTYTVTIDTTRQYQTMDGFGASFTEASAYLLIKKLTKDQRQELLNQLFDKENGIGISMLRQPIGASDHVLGQYDFASKPDDFDLKYFDIGHDTLYKIPAVQQALKINPDRIKVTCATWSPPAWMKTNNSFIGKAKGIEGHLKENCYGTYAEYLYKFIEAYAKAGIPMYSTSIQNEPDNPSTTWPAMRMSAEEQIKFVKNYLGPLFKSRGVTTKIWCWDHNFSTPDYPMGLFAEKVLSDKEASQYLAGSAWHWYSEGFPETLQKIHQLFPDKEIHFTEGSGGEWGYSKQWKDGFKTGISYIINLPRNFSKSIVWWNIALDEMNGPDYYYQTVKTHSTCRGLVKIFQESGNITYTVDYYSMGHISKFVDPGAKRVESNQMDGKLENVAFLNPNGSKVLIAHNPQAKDVKFQVKLGEMLFEDTIPAGSAITYQW